MTLIPALILAAASCGLFPKARVPVEFRTELDGSLLYAADKRAASGHVEFSGPVEFPLEPPLAIPPLVSLELEYGPLSGGAELSYGGAAGKTGEKGRETVSFMLPDLPDLSDLSDLTREEALPPVFRYAVPLEGDTLGIIRIAVPETGALELNYLGLAGRWYGVERDSRGLRLSPFVFSETPGSVGIDV
ncbi:MAG: hypothetical protein LBF63_04230, partial [Treponema sp.]|nr:hypothetical protein [Treponema sp.]